MLIHLWLNFLPVVNRIPQKRKQTETPLQTNFHIFRLLSSKIYSRISKETDLLVNHFINLKRTLIILGQSIKGYVEGNCIKS